MPGIGATRRGPAPSTTITVLRSDPVRSEEARHPGGPFSFRGAELFPAEPNHGLRVAPPRAFSAHVWGGGGSCPVEKVAPARSQGDRSRRSLAGYRVAIDTIA